MLVKLLPKTNTYARDSILSYTVLGNRQITSIFKHSGYSSWNSYSFRDVQKVFLITEVED